MTLDTEPSKTLCKKCELENCEKCYGVISSSICISCKSPFIPIYDSNNRIILCDTQCETGEGEKCKSCNEQGNQCSSCISGYYIPTDDEIKKNCKKCSINNCKECYGDSISNTCHICEDPFKLIYYIDQDIFKCLIM